MADRKITLKRNNAGTTEILYPTTTADQIYTINGVDQIFDTANKLKYSYLPEGIVGGLKFQGTITSENVDTDAEIASLLDDMIQNYGGKGGALGSYWIASEPLIWENATADASLGNPLRYYNWSFEESAEESADGTNVGMSFEPGDWIVIISITGEGTLASPYSFLLSQINNTYQNATDSQRGVVELATNAETSTGTDNQRAVTPAGLANVLTSYVTTDNDTTYAISVGGADDAPTIVLTAGGSGSGDQSISFSTGELITLNITGNDIEIGSNAPNISLNGSTAAKTGNFTFYAPTASGTAGTASVSRQALFSAGTGAAPTWADAPKVFYDDTTGWLHGDIVIDVDA